MRQPRPAPLDQFETVNDSAGHEVGDPMLCRVAGIWRPELPAGVVQAVTAVTSSP